MPGKPFLKSAMLKIKASKIQSFLPLQYSYALNQVDSFHVPELDIAFIPNPKVANRSIKLAIAKKINPNFSGDPHSANWQYLSNNSLQNYTGFKFGFVRNPLDRLYSCYKQKIVLYARTYNQPILFWRYGNKFHKDMSFEEFVMTVSKIPDWYADIHFRSQHTFFYRKNQLLVDFLGHFENLKHDWQEINQTINIGPLPHLNASLGFDWQCAYSRETAALAMQRYRKDIEYFNYNIKLDEII